MIAEEVGQADPGEDHHVERDEDPRDYRVNFDRIAALGFEPRMRLADGIREIAAAVARRPHHRSLRRPVPQLVR